MRRLLLAGVGRALRPARRRFLETLDDPAAAQARVLARLTERLAHSDYGRHLGVRTPDDFLARVPVVDYAALSPWLERQRQSEAAVLTDERVLFYEKTSGSTAAAKYIPYTASLRRSFSRMFAVWAADLLAIGPRLDRGKIYLSVSPSFSHEPPTERGLPVGMTDDRDYLDGWLRRAVSPFVVYDAEAARARDVETFKRRTAALLVATRDLEILSVWSPSFLKVLLDEITARHGIDDWQRLWPRLKLVSCWASASAAPQARALAQLLPGVMVQGKGLLATEAPITVPLIAARAPMPLIDEVLLELEDDAGRLVPVQQGVEGREYGIVVSQSGGLYRYRLGDRVVVAASYRNTPGLEFVGRAGGVSDLCGEKLDERFVAAALEGLAPAAFVKTLVPLREPRDHYVLVVDRLDGDGAAAALAGALDQRLRRAHHYHHARELGQLAAPRVCIAANAAAVVTGAWADRGIKLGDIKPRALHTGPVDGSLHALLAVERAFGRLSA